MASTNVSIVPHRPLNILSMTSGARKAVFGLQPQSSLKITLAPTFAGSGNALVLFSMSSPERTRSDVVNNTFVTGKLAGKTPLH